MFIRKLEAEKNKRFSQPLLMIKSLERRQLKVRVLLYAVIYFIILSQITKSVLNFPNMVLLNKGKGQRGDSHGYILNLYFSSNNCYCSLFNDPSRIS